MSTVQALSAPQGLSMPTAKKIFAFASMCVGMFIALIDIQIVSASLRDIGGGLSAGDDETVGTNQLPDRRDHYYPAFRLAGPGHVDPLAVCRFRGGLHADEPAVRLGVEHPEYDRLPRPAGLAGGSMIPVFTTAFAFFRANSGSSPRRRSAAASSPYAGSNGGRLDHRNWLFHIAVAVPLLVK